MEESGLLAILTAVLFTTALLANSVGKTTATSEFRSACELSATIVIEGKAYKCELVK